MNRLDPNDPQVDPNAGGNPGGTPTAAEATPEPDPTPDPAPTPDPDPDQARLRMQKRIDKLTAQLSSSRKTVEELKSGRTVQAQTPEEFEALVEARAAERQKVESFGRRSSEAANEGKKEFGEKQFQDRINALTTLIDQNDKASQERYVRFIETALETGKAHVVCFELGADLDKAEEILNMTPTQQAIALDRLAQGSAPKGTAAPRPITPIGSKGPAHTAITPDDKDNSDRLSTAEWMKRREAQVAAQRGRR